MATQPLKPLEILLADDNPGDVRLFIESLKDGKVLNHLNVAWDGEEAMRLSQAKGGKRTCAPPGLHHTGHKHAQNDRDSKSS